jgi:hypothetical protein
MNERSLDAIGLQHGTDKSSRHHDYLNFYDGIFSRRRQAPLKILEIGVLNGASVRTWQDYFPNALIVGCDIDPMARRWASERVEIEYMDQSNLEDLVRIGRKHGPFDLVIEDGSHLWEHQTTTLRTLFPFVRPEGWYVVEDLQTNYGDYQHDYRGVARQSCVEFLKSWLDLHIADNAVPLHPLEDSFLRTYGRGARSITFYKRVCLIEKRALPIPINAAPLKPLIPPHVGREVVRVGLIAHVSHVGDIFGPDGYVDLGHDRFTFQGVSADDPSHTLEYRVRGADLIWGPWLAAPDFAGTRGKAMILTGAAVRIREDRLNEFRVNLVGRFAGSDVLVVVGNGEDCVSAHDAELRGLQIILERAPETAVVLGPASLPGPMK